MKTVTFDKRKLLSISRDGLAYVDDQGGTCTIDFHTCRENFEKQRHPPPHLKDVYVGLYDFGAKPPHIILATDPPTRFIFPIPGNDFHEFERRLFMAAGVRTFDPT